MEKKEEATTLPGPTTPEYDNRGFAKGADVGWLTEMEKSGIKFYSPQGVESECMRLLRNLGMNSIRLRVWVDPEDGWNNGADVVAKALRAHQLDMRIMIDFHYSDSWADPGKQTKPAAWANYSFEELKEAVGKHTEEVLEMLKTNGITPEWVQVGNETRDGMLWDEGRASKHMDQYAALTNAGYTAVKKVFKDTKVIVHIDHGDDNELYKWLFDGLKQHNGKYDMIGMSLYPTVENWEKQVQECIANIKDLTNRYNTEVMICEVGMPWDQAEVCYKFLTDLIKKAQAIESCKGIFYWEPQAYGNWKGYSLGAFDDSGKATQAMNAFK
ncbi:MAG: glycoside hydrolase family 53 protein [Phocaeicola sp.]